MLLLSPAFVTPSLTLSLPTSAPLVTATFVFIRMLGIQIKDTTQSDLHSDDIIIAREENPGWMKLQGWWTVHQRTLG